MIRKIQLFMDLGTEGYRIASSLAIRGFKVSLIDEAARMAITLKPEVAELLSKCFIFNGR